MLIQHRHLSPDLAHPPWAGSRSPVIRQGGLAAIPSDDAPPLPGDVRVTSLRIVAPNWMAIEE
jgi:hypothetical protein